MKIVLIGDSIRMGYDKYVRDALDGAAEVFYPNENCRFAEYVLRYAHDWKNSGKWGDDVDLVHWNAGLWDVLELFGDEPLSTRDFYKYTIPRIDKRLRMLFPKAKMVFATSTPVNEKIASPDFYRHNTTIEEYNALAVEALAGTDTVINDLYSLMKNVPDDYHSDFVHFYTKQGTELIGGKVLSVICKQLSLSPSQIKIENFQPEKYDRDEIGY